MTTTGAPHLGGLHALVDDDPRWQRDPVAQARAACAGGAHVVQLRAKQATDRQILAWAAAIRALTRRAGTLFFVNDRFDLALVAGADGVHLGQDDLPPNSLPPDVRHRLLVGRSTHDDTQVEAARREGVDYVAFGPVFATASKQGALPARGLEALARAVALARPLPLIAIGGIDAKHARSVAEAGATGVAVIGALAAAEAPEVAARELARNFPSDDRP